MKSINPYLFFPGNCEEALHFYKETLGGEVTALQRFGDTQMPVEENYRDKIMHAELTVNEQVVLMFSDGAPFKEIQLGDNVHLTLSFENEEEQTQVFNTLAKGGVTTMELQDTFWGARYGMLTDKFGVKWQLNLSRS